MCGAWKLFVLAASRTGERSRRSFWLDAEERAI
jgi:hypothetical protein